MKEDHMERSIPVPESGVSREPAYTPVSHIHSAGVSWPAVMGGAFVTAALSLILLSLGTGLGLSSISPWTNTGASASTIGTAAIVWVIMMQLIASAMGGYLAGRLRTKWVSIHSDEVYFRDTAHGFLAWAVAVVITAAFLASTAASMAGGALQAGPSATATSGAAAIVNEAEAYFVDMLLRSDHPSTAANDSLVRAESGRIFAHALRQNDLPATDQAYLAQLVSANTGLSKADADKRVSDVVGQAKQATDTARKTAAHLSLWIFIALLVGAFSASLAATFGGSQRDHVVIV
jgi:hypothetical protein